MRIGLNAIVPKAPDPGKSTKSGSQVASGNSSAGLEGDTAKLSQNQGRVQELVSQVNQIPEIRQDKVAALQRAIGEGSYQVTPAQAAEALISARQIRSAA
jgi:negative regulator of flagellin synthesis FlgM